MSEWCKVKFGDVVSFPPKCKLVKGEVYPYVELADVDIGFKYVYSSGSKEYGGSGSKFENGDTLFARITPSLENGKIAQIKNLDKTGFGSGEFFIFRGKDGVTDSDFIYYLSQTQAFKDNAINSMVGASGRQRADNKFVAKTEINLPPLPTQQKVAKILSNYDDLIENNLKRIKLLEESARLTYEEWFLRFRIDGQKLEIDPESGLPFGWEYKLMKDFGEVVTGKTPSTNNESYYCGDIPFVKTPSMHGNTYTLETADYLTSLGANSQQNKFLSKNSLMVSCIGTAGVYSLVASNCQTNQQINSIKFYKDEYIFYIYGFAGHLTNVLDAIGSNGATMTNVNKTKFENIEVPMPSADLLEKFHNTFNPNFESILNIMKQNQLLKEARDIFLPRLMTGMIDTDDLDVAV